MSLAVADARRVAAAAEATERIAEEWTRRARELIGVESTEEDQ